MDTNAVKQALGYLEMHFGQTRDRSRVAAVQEWLEAQAWNETIFKKAIGRMVTTELDQRGIPGVALIRKYVGILEAEQYEEEVHAFNERRDEFEAGLSVTDRYWYDQQRHGWKAPTFELREGGRDPEDYLDVYERMAEDDPHRA